MHQQSPHIATFPFQYSHEEEEKHLDEHHVCPTFQVVYAHCLYDDGCILES